MNFSMVRLGLMSVALCICQAVSAQDRLHFWPVGSEHGINGCILIAIPTEADPKRLGWIVLGVSVDRQKLEPVSKITLRQDGIPSGYRVLEIGVGRQVLGTVALAPEDARTSTGHLPGKQMEELLRLSVRQKTLWLRIDDASGHTVKQASLAVVGEEDDVSSCLATLERDLAGERALRAAGGMSDRFWLFNR